MSDISDDFDIDHNASRHRFEVRPGMLGYQKPWIDILAELKKEVEPYKVDLVKDYAPRKHTNVWETPAGYYDGWMTVGELRAYLEQFDQNLPVIVEGRGWESEHFCVTKDWIEVTEDKYMLSRRTGPHERTVDDRGYTVWNIPDQEPIPFLQIGSRQ